MKLYFIAAVDQNDAENNLDLFVWANNPTEAIIYWRNYYDIFDHVIPDKIFIVPCDRPDGQQPGALHWSQDIQEARLELVEAE